MNITFFIGNGFDLNLGLKTSFIDFIKIYKNESSDNEIIKNFKQKICENQELWSNAEVAFGKYTADFSDADDFLDCHMDFCKSLGEYLEKQEARINYDRLQEILPKLFVESLSSIGSSLLPESDTIRNTSFYTFNFIVFNYTKTVDMCLDLCSHLFTESERQDGVYLRLNGISYPSVLGRSYHIHGYTDKNMVLGVHDESQIANLKMFLGRDPEYISGIIKQRANNFINMNQMDKQCQSLLNKSDYIYIYGMSLGETDILWWERICQWLLRDKNHKVIIHAFKAPPEGNVRTRFRMFEREIQDRFIGYSNVTSPDIQQQIQVTGSNIFSPMCNLVNSQIGFFNETIPV